MLDGTFGTIKSEMGCHGETHSLNTMPILGLDNTLILDISSTWNMVISFKVAAKL